MKQHRQVNYEYSDSIERLKQNGVSDNKIAEIMQLPLDYVRLVQHVMKNKDTKRISFYPRDFDVSEYEIETIGDYNPICIDMERDTRCNCADSFSERLKFELKK